MAARPPRGLTGARPIPRLGLSGSQDEVRMMLPSRAAFLGLFLLAGPLAAGAPVMSLEEVDLSTEEPIVNLKLFLTGEAEFPPLFLLGVRWEPLRLEFLGVTWRGTIFQ